MLRSATWLFAIVVSCPGEPQVLWLGRLWARCGKTRRMTKATKSEAHKKQMTGHKKRVPGVVRILKDTHGRRQRPRQQLSGDPCLT